MAAGGALEAGEAGGEVATAEEGFDGGGGGRVERAEILAVFGLTASMRSGPASRKCRYRAGAFVVGEEFIPAVVDELPEGRGAGAARLVNGRHEECS